jgi:FecR-like protein
MDHGVEVVLAEVAERVQLAARRRNIAHKVHARLASFDAARSRRRSWLAWAAAGTLAGAAAVAVVALFPHPLSYAVAGAGAGEAAPLGAPLSALNSHPLELEFSDGSRVTVPPHALARIDGLDRDGATVALEDGTLELSVVHRARTRWQVHAGGYIVHVTGTRFAAGWDPRAQALTVEMHEGSVLVTGPGLKQPVRVVTGQRLRASLGAAELGFESPPSIAAREEMPELPDLPEGETPRGPPAAPPSPEPPAAGGAGAQGTVDRAHMRARRLEASVGQGGAPLDWREHAARAEYREALAAAIVDGWRGECARLGADDLVLLGDVARLSGDLPRAEEAYRAARRRFPSADRPVFALGLIAFERRHDYGAAGDWFATYLRLFPRGPLAREASGRLIESRIKAGESVAAREAARSYLGAYPNGPHATLARRAVDR